ncbi:50S ribosomal protein L18 [Candidatus Gottesmanbacteria bacterium]|nr:50S ribosomal protein L18 [Candidatus Gottesmanbacteria bacterium]
MIPRTEQRHNRQRRIRAVIRGTKTIPRASVFRSQVRISVQLIDDKQAVTIVSSVAKGKNKKAARDLGLAVATLAKGKGIKKIVFDRGGNKYHGSIQSLADAMREGGLQF